jgi:amidohydrolase
VKRILLLAILAGTAADIAETRADDLASRIAATTSARASELIATRRWFHQHPELSNREHETAAEIARRLIAMGYEPRTQIARNGVVAVLQGDRPGPVVAWRADIDALPISEQVDVPYRSINEGVMHACGHDVHITVALGVAEVLMMHRAEVAGTVVFIFQPAEEGPPPGEEGGAPLMIKEGVLTDPRPTAIFGLHVMPTLPVGAMGWGSEGVMAAADRFTIKIQGRMTHGSAPHDGVDAVCVGSHVVTALQAIPSREIDAREALVVSVGTFHAGNRFNIVADEAILTGTVRSLDQDTWEKIPGYLERVVAGVCTAFRASYILDYERINPVTWNDPDLADFAANSLQRALGEENVIAVKPILAAEDFAHYQQEIPGVYLQLGVGNEAAGWTDYVHTPTFRPDETAIVVGVTGAATLLTDFLARRPLGD